MTAREQKPFERLTIVADSEMARAAMDGEVPDTLQGLKSRLRQVLAPELELADPITVRLALAVILPDLVNEDPWFGPIARRGGRAWLGVVDAVYDAVGFLREHGDALAIASGSSVRDATRDRARFFSRVMANLDRELARVGLWDFRSEAALVADRVARGDALAVFHAVGARHVLARGIVGWSLSDLALLRVLDAVLSRVGGRATVELPVLDKPLDAERARDPFETVMDAVAAALDDAPLTRTIVTTLGDMQLSAPFRTESGRVDVYRAADSEAQGRAVADAVHMSLASGANPSDIAVAWVSTDDAAAEETLRALAEAGISVSDERRERSRRSNLVSLALRILELPERPTPRHDVALLLRSPYVDALRVLEGLGEDEAQARRTLRTLARALEETRTAAATGTVGRLEATALASNVSAPDRRGRLGVVARRFDAFVAWLSSGKSRVDHLAAARRIWSGLGFRPQAPQVGSLSTDGPAASLSDALVAALGRDAQAWASLQEGLVDCERALRRLGYDHAPATLETFRHELAWCMARGVAPPAAAGYLVRFVNFADLPMDASALVVIADADAAEWPEGRVRAQLITPALDERLALASDPALRPMNEAGAAQVLARLAEATAETHRVVFTYRVRDEAGAVLTPAPVVRWASGGVEPPLFRSGVGVARPLTPRDHILTLLSRSPDRASTLVPDVARRALLEQRREDAFGASLSQDDPLTATHPQGGAFTRILTEETGGGDRALSASAIDRMASCAFRGFAAEVLRPRRHTLVHDVPDAREAGLIVHAALAEAFLATKALWRTRPRDAESIMRLGLEAADRSLSRNSIASILGRALSDQTRDGVRRVLAWSIADEEWDFAFAEQGVSESDPNAWKEVVIERLGSRVRLRGRIDRVDVAHGGGALRIIDYKLRERGAHDHTASFGETKFQLAIYGRAAEAALGVPATHGAYLPIQRLRTGTTPGVPANVWASAREVVDGSVRIETTMVDLVGAVRAGKVAVRPYSAASCLYCDYSGICRKPRFASQVVVDDSESGAPNVGLSGDA